MADVRVYNFFTELYGGFYEKPYIIYLLIA